MFKLFSDKQSPYRDCGSCTLPYIDNVNGRNGLCDFCADGKDASPPPKPKASPSTNMTPSETRYLREAPDWIPDDVVLSHSRRHPSYRLF